MSFENKKTPGNVFEARSAENDQQREERIRKEMATLLNKRSQILDQEISSAMIEKGFTKRPAPKVERFHHGKLDIQFVGVHHVVQTLPDHRKIIEAAIAEADIVISETSIETSGAASDAGAVQTHSSQIVRDSERAEMLYPVDGVGDTFSDRTFFYEVENMIKKHGKQVVFFDPYSDRRFLQSVAPGEGKSSDHGLKLLRRDLEIREYSQEAATVGSALAEVAVGLGAIDWIAQSYTDRSADPQDKVKERISRRNFLKRGAGYVAGAALGKTVEQKADENIRVIESDTDPGQHVFQYNLNDFRDVAVATGIDRLSQSVTKPMKVAIIYGDYHRNGVRYYLERPEQLRSIKASLYGPYSEIAPPEMTAYRYALGPDILSGKVALRDVPEKDWGAWRETVRARL